MYSKQAIYSKERNKMGSLKIFVVAKFSAI